MKTVYVRRPTEDAGVQSQVKSKAEGGEVDAVVDSFPEIVALLSASSGSFPRVIRPHHYTRSRVFHK